MNVLVGLEMRFVRTPDGRVWTPGVFTPDFWARYLDVFDEVLVAARVLARARPERDWVRADGDRIAFLDLPPYRGPWEYLRSRRRLGSVLRRGLRPEDAIILRVPSQIALAVEKCPGRHGRPFALEVVGDPGTTFSKGGVSHPLRWFFRLWFGTQLRRQCLRSCGVAYVTSGTLQKRYPAGSGAMTAAYSSIDLPDDRISSAPRVHGRHQGPYRLISVGSMEQPYKGFDVLLDAVARCVSQGWDLELEILGEGRYRRHMESLRSVLGLERRVIFRGHVSGETVRSRMDAACLFILPSRTEGLPRSVIEAMASGLPCIGTRVGGIPELLPHEDLVEPGNASELAGKIMEVLADPSRLDKMSYRNLREAGRFADSVLRAGRSEFYRYVKRATLDWVTNKEKPQ